MDGNSASFKWINSLLHHFLLLRITSSWFCEGVKQASSSARRKLMHWESEATFLPGAHREMPWCYILISSQDVAIVQALMKTLYLSSPWITLTCPIVKEERHGTLLAHRREVAALYSCVSEALTLSAPEANAIQCPQGSHWPLLVLAIFQAQKRNNNHPEVYLLKYLCPTSSWQLTPLRWRTRGSLKCKERRHSPLCTTHPETSLGVITQWLWNYDVQRKLRLLACQRNLLFLS